MNQINLLNPLERHVQSCQLNFEESFINLRSSYTYWKGSIINPVLPVRLETKMNWTSLNPRPNHISSLDF